MRKRFAGGGKTRRKQGVKSKKANDGINPKGPDLLPEHLQKKQKKNSSSKKKKKKKGNCGPEDNSARVSTRPPRLKKKSDDGKKRRFVCISLVSPLGFPHQKESKKPLLQSPSLERKPQIKREAPSR
jgi:hypothetical protein